MLCLASFTQPNGSEIHPCCISSYFSIAEFHKDNLFICSQVGGYLSCFQFLVARNRADENIPSQVFKETYAIISLWQIPESQTVGPWSTYMFKFVSCPFPKVAKLFCIPTMYETCSCLAYSPAVGGTSFLSVTLKSGTF